MVVCGAVGVSRRHTMAASVHVHPGPAADMAQLTLHDQDSDSDVTDNATIALGTSPTPAVAAAGMLITLSLTRLLFCLFIYLSNVTYNVHSKFHNAAARTDRQIYCTYVCP